MDELRLNKLFAAFLFAALLLMAGIKISDIMVPHQKLAQNSYVIEVAETTASTAAAPVKTGPEPILAMLAGADLDMRNCLRNAQPVMSLKLMAKMLGQPCGIS